MSKEKYIATIKINSRDVKRKIHTN